MKILTEQIVRTNEYFQTTKATNAATNPTIKLPNCTTFCMCAWHWLIDATKKYTLFNGRGPGAFGNAKDWYANYVFDKGASPRIGAIACWTGNYGHVALVKGYTDLGNGYYNINVYQSNYSGVYFEEKTYKVKVGVAGIRTLGAFQGFCYHPYYKEEPTPSIADYTVGRVYTTQYGLNVRVGPGTNYAKKTKAQLSKNAQQYADANGVLNKGTRVTCLEITKDKDGNTWIRIPSGFVCAIFKGNKYIK